MHRFKNMYLYSVASIIFWALGVNFSPLYGAEKNIKMTIKPTSCIVMNKGEVCKSQIKIYWNTLDNIEYCLFSSLKAAPLLCWYANQMSNYENKVAASDNVIYQVRVKNTVIAQKKLKIQWVYKSSRHNKNAWRLF